MDQFTTTKARQLLSDLVSRVEFGKETIGLTRRSRTVAVLMPVDVYERLVAYEDDLEDAYLSRLAQEARADIEAGEGTIPHEVVARRVSGE